MGGYEMQPIVNGLDLVEREQSISNVLRDLLDLR